MLEAKPRALYRLQKFSKIHIPCPMTGRAVSAVCIQKPPPTHTQTQLNTQTPFQTHPGTQLFYQKIRRLHGGGTIIIAGKLLGLQCHSLLSGQHSIGRNILSENKVWSLQLIPLSHLDCGNHSANLICPYFSSSWPDLAQFLGGHH